MGWENNFKQYDTSEGFGNARQWKRAFHERMSPDEAAEILEAQDDTPHGILGVSKNATQDEIKKAYRKKMLEWHPDRNQHRIEEATRMSKLINAAYAMLSH